MDKKFLDSIGVKYLWDKIMYLLARKIDRVKNSDGSITVQNDDTVSVNLSDSKNNALIVEPGKGLYVSATPTLHKLTFGAGQEYVYDGTEDVTVPVYDGSHDIN